MTLAPNSTPKILVVDDNAANRQLARATLEDEGYCVILANDGHEAIETFAREAPDCSLLDVRMPGIDGPSACERIRALPGGHDTPVVFLTAQRDEAQGGRIWIEDARPGAAICFTLPAAAASAV